MSEAINPEMSLMQLGESAIRELSKLSIPPLPQYYQIWFSHLQRKNKNLSSEIDQITGAGKPIDEIFLNDVHKKYFTEIAIRKEVEQCANGILLQAADLEKIAKKFNSSAKEFSKDLDDTSSHIALGLGSEDEIKVVMASLLNATQKAVERNNELEKNLSDATTQIASLQQSIDLVANDANTDSLTGLYNRRFFDSSMLQLLEDARAAQKPLCLITGDIDFFKKFNDTWGHQVGDQVLKLVAAVFREKIKGQDIVARYGGEEFCILLPNTRLMNAAKLADTLRVEVNKKKLVNKVSNTDLGRITMSFGVAQYDNTSSPEEFFNNADTALYAAKNAGRNQVLTTAQIGLA